MRRAGDPRAVLKLEEIAEPSCGDDELLVDVEIAGLSFADLLLIRGEYQISLPLPCVPGSELVGRVRSTGARTSTPEGTRVIGLAKPPNGAYAEQAVVIENQSQSIPEGLDGPAAVALIGNYSQPTTRCTAGPGFSRARRCSCTVARAASAAPRSRSRRRRERP
jgi:NADPH2:quinone reductase